MINSKLKILLIHNYTKGYATGGEANVFEDEAKLLESKGHTVKKLYTTNSEGMDASLIDKIKLFINAPWLDKGYQKVKKELSTFKPDIVHVHNFFFMFSPKIFLAFYEKNIPVVVTLHNYRLVVPCSQMIRNHKTCDICLGKNPWRIMLYRCYKNSFFASLFRYRFYYTSQKKHNWWQYINRFIALTQNGKDILVKGGLPKDKIVIKPNFIHDFKVEEIHEGYGALYIGTLTPEKGVLELVARWEHIDYPLTIIGTGELESTLKKKAKNNKNIKFTGVISREAVVDKIKGCSFVIVPSIWHEPFGLVNIEAMCLGKPILASRMGAMKDIIEEGINGYLFSPFDDSEFLEKLNKFITRPKQAHQMGLKAREIYLKKYTPDENYEQLISIYQNTINNETT